MRELIPTGEATAILPTNSGKPITVIGTESIRSTFDELCLEQAVNSRLAPGVTDLVLNPDGHCGYGAPIGCVLVSPTHVYPGPVGVDIKCSMSLLQFDLPADEIVDRPVRRKLIDAVCERIPTGTGRGQRHAKKSRKISADIGRKLLVEGATNAVCEAMGIPTEWANRCEDAAHCGHDDTSDSLAERLDRLLAADAIRNFPDKISQLGSYGGGNHFGECEVVQVLDNPRARAVADVFGLQDGRVAFLSHCGSRGIGHTLAMGQFRALQHKFAEWDIPLPGNDRELVYAPLGTPEADAYLDDMALGANFATLNHLLINALVQDAFAEVFPVSRASWFTSLATILRAGKSSTTPRHGYIAREPRGLSLPDTMRSRVRSMLTRAIQSSCQAIPRQDRVSWSPMQAHRSAATASITEQGGYWVANGRSVNWISMRSISRSCSTTS